MIKNMFDFCWSRSIGCHLGLGYVVIDILAIQIVFYWVWFCTHYPPVLMYVSLRFFIESGKLMARYCVSYDTMYKIHQLTGQESQEQLVSATCIYFKDLKSRKVHHDLHSFLCMNLIITAMHIDSCCCSPLSMCALVRHDVRIFGSIDIFPIHFNFSMYLA